MSTRSGTRILVVEHGEPDARDYATFLRDAGGYEVEITGTLLGALSKLTGNEPDAVLLSLNLPDSTGIQTYSALRAHAPQVPVVLLGPDEDERLSTLMVRNGADDYLPKVRLTAQTLVRAMRHAILRSQSRPETAVPVKAATVIGVLAARGGVGATTVACYLALHLALRKEKVLLADLDCGGGSTAVLLKPNHRNSLPRMLESLQRMDRALWEGIVGNHSSGLHILDSDLPLNSSSDFTSLRIALRFARAQYSFLVLDLSRPSGYNFGLLEECSDLLLVASTSIPALHAAKRIAPQIAPGPGVRLVVRQEPTSQALSLSDMRELFGIADCRWLPACGAELNDAISEGRLLPEASAFRKAIDGIAAAYLPEAPQPEVKRGGALSRLLGFATASIG